MYFYYELSDCIGPNKSHEWLQTCADDNRNTFHEHASSVTSCNSLRSRSSCSASFGSADMFDLSMCTSRHSAEGTIQTGAVEICKEGLSSQTGTAEAFDYKHISVPSYLCLDQESPANLGLLYTDAAHIVLQQSVRSKSAKSIRKFNSSQF